MGSGVNKCILVGTLGKDPEVRYGQSGTAMVNFPIATNETWNDKDGKRQERTEWHKIVGFGKVAEVCGEHLQKGRQVYIEGKLQTRSFDDKDGVKRYTTEVLMQSMQFIGGKNDGPQREQDQGPQFRTPVGDRRGGPAPQREQPQASMGYDAGYDDSDVPF